jgi:hypothetical protein
MVLKIDSSADGKCLLLRLSGRLQGEHLRQLKAEMREAETVALDLEDVKLVDVDAVRFLAGCEAKGIELRQCAPYIREWILKERATPGDGSEE